jgi:hypothetical protein
MALASANTIMKDSFGLDVPDVERVISTGTTAAPLKPGNLVKVLSSGQFDLQSTAIGQSPAVLLIEDKFQGDHTTGAGVDKIYASGARARAVYPQPGMLAYVRVPTSQTLVIGDEMMYNNAGQLVKASGSPLKIVAVSEEAITTSAEDLVLVRFA